MSSDSEHEAGRAGARDEKRAQFTQGAKGGGRLKMIVLVVALAAVAGLLVFSAVRGGGDGAAELKPTAGAGEVRVPLKDLAAGKAVFFEPKLASGKPVRFFVVKSADNTYRAALDACEVCFHAKKGYQQKGPDMVCRNCGRSFAINDIGPHNEGGCNPVALAQKIEGDSLVIKTSELEKGNTYF